MCLHLRSAIVAAIVAVGAAGAKRADAIRRMISGIKERGWMMEGKAKFGMPKRNGNKLLSLRKIALLDAIEQPVKISSSHFAEAIESSMQTAARRLKSLIRKVLYGGG